MKSAVLADTHFGVRGDDKNFVNNMYRFYKYQFFPYLVETGIQHIIHAGDVFDNRYKIDVDTLRQVNEFFFDELVNNSIEMDVVVGNHDMYYAESMKSLAIKEMLGSYADYVNIYDKPTMMQYDKVPLMYIPWLCQETREATTEMIARSVNSQTVGFGHLQLVGYKQYSTSVATKGDDPVSFKDFRKVYTGHFHHPNESGNIAYLGSVSQHTWADEPDTKGFHIFDHTTGDMQFIANKFPLFKNIDKSEIDGIGVANLKELYLRVRYNIDEYDKTLFDILVNQNYKAEFIPNKSSIDIAESQMQSVSADDVETVGTVSIIEETVSEESVREKLIHYYNKAHSGKNAKV